jgi:Rrf2 family protein
MKRLNRKVEYALMGLKIMAQKRPGELTSAKEIVKATGSPFDATARVLQQLAQKKILRSEQGAHGGYVVIRDLAKVSLYELMELILGPMAVAKCISEQSGCELRESCNIVSPVSILNRKVVEFYQGVTVGELLRLKERAEERGTVEVSS